MASTKPEEPWNAVVLLKDLNVESLSIDAKAKVANKFEDAPEEGDAGAGKKEYKGFALWINAPFGSTRKFRICDFRTYAPKPCATPKPGQKYKPWDKLAMEVHLDQLLHSGEIKQLAALNDKLRRDIYFQKAMLGLGSLDDIASVKGTWRKHFLVAHKDAYKLVAFIVGWGAYIDKLTFKDWKTPDNKVIQLINNVEYKPRWVDDPASKPQGNQTTTRFYLRLPDETITHEIEDTDPDTGKPRYRFVGPQDMYNGVTIEAVDIDPTGLHFGAAITHKATILKVVMAFKRRAAGEKKPAVSGSGAGDASAGAGDEFCWTTNDFGPTATRASMASFFKVDASFTHTSTEIPEAKADEGGAGTKRPRMSAEQKSTSDGSD